MPEEIKTAEAIDFLIGETWNRVKLGQPAEPLVRHLQFLLREYDNQSMTSVPPSTLWLANEVIDLSHRQ